MIDDKSREINDYLCKNQLKLGKRIRAVREFGGYTQKEFCALFDMAQSTLSAYETDKMQPTLSALINIAKKFNVSLDWLCGIDIDNGTAFTYDRRCAINSTKGED